MENNNTSGDRSITAYKGDFEVVYGIIASHRNRVVQQVNGESVMMVWEVGGFPQSSNCANRIGTITTHSICEQEVVRFALNRSMSPTMVAQYKEQLQVGGVIQRSLVEFCKFLENAN